MRNNLFMRAALAAAVTTGTVHAEDQQQPMPPPKPLQSPSTAGFLEGVDVPPAKPPPKSSRDLPGGAAAMTRTTEMCHIEGVLFEPTEPEKGDGEPEIGTGCGIENPIRLTGLQHGNSTVSFAASVTVSCDFARTLTVWLQRDVQREARARFGKSVASITTGPGYQCRRRNNLSDEKLSEHALGKAIDLSFLQLSDGLRISVEKDWGKETKNGQFLTAIHASACERFMTVLGPGADPNHKSHIHLDVGCHGKDCTYIICQ